MFPDLPVSSDSAAGGSSSAAGSAADAAIFAAKRRLVAGLRGKGERSESEVEHSSSTIPWRSHWKFFYFHSLRVDAICQKLAALEAPALLPAEALTLRLAAILHDIAKLDVSENHAAPGAQIAAGWLAANPEIAAQVDPARVVDLIARHSEKAQPGPDLGHALLKDADTLDEIGVFSLLMSAHWLDQTSPYFFYDLAERLQQSEIPYCEKKSAGLQTAAARAYLAQKQRFLQTVIEQFSIELAGVLRDDAALLGEE